MTLKIESLIQPPQEGEISTTQELEARRCPFKHEWNFNQPTVKPALLEGQLRGAIRHMVVFKHEIDGEEYGGLKPDAQLAQKLSIRLFQKAGLTEPVVLRFQGDIAKVVEFGWPEGFPVILPSPDTKDFWQALEKDLEAIDMDRAKMTIRKFLLYFDPEKNKEGHESGNRGKYALQWQSHFLRRDEQAVAKGSNFGDFLRRDFIPPEDDPEFGETVSKVRDLIDVKLHKPYGSGREVPTRLADATFWGDFAKDVSLLEEDLSFQQFSRHFNPQKPSETSLYYADGKYRDIYAYLGREVRVDSKLQEPDEEQEDSGNGVRAAVAKRVNKLFYEHAPKDMRLFLVARFPKDFGEYAAQALEEQDFLSGNTKAILEVTGLLETDTQSQVLDALVNYIKVKQSSDAEVAYTDEDLQTVLLEAANSLQIQAQSQKQPTLDKVLIDSSFLPGLISETESTEGLSQEAAEKLLGALSEAYYLPMFKSLLYKPASLFWNMYYANDPEGKMAPNTLVDFLNGHVADKVDLEGLSPDQEITLSYFKESILPTLYERFAKVVDYESQINYFRQTRNSRGRTTHLFLHQVEGIMDLVEREGAVLGDEPGTGKTLILALGALNLLDKKEAERAGQPGRVLVVGSKTVINNWEGELKTHITSDDIDIINVNFTEEQEAQDVDFKLSQRLQELEKALQQGEGSKQITLVNYDLFRHPNFQRILQKYNFDVLAIDEAHNVRSRFLESIDQDLRERSGKGDKLAQRTVGLYDYILDHPDMDVFWATGTPFVKSLAEPLIMAHLIDRDQFPLDRIKALVDDPVGTHQALRKIMIRRRKEEIADLPPKETRLAPIDLNDLTEEEQGEFFAVAQEIMENGDKGKSARFYSLLALEGLAKYPWLIDKVQEIVADGRKVLIFTPFVTGEDRNTSPISTTRIMQKLTEAGMSSVGILDGTLTDAQRLATQRAFHLPPGDIDGLDVIVGNYVIAGESLTLNSPDNRATDVIIFAPPDRIDRFLQAIDRIHRFGQEENVTIHIPYVTGDLLGRRGGTYDERIVKHLNKELSMFSGVVDGLFFVGSSDIYQTIAQSETPRTGTIRFKVDERRDATERTRKAAAPKRAKSFYFRDKSQEPDFTGSEVNGATGTDLLQELSEEIVEENELTTSFSTGVSSEEDFGAEGFSRFLQQVHTYDFLEFGKQNVHAEQERILFTYLRSGASVRDLEQDEAFMATISPGNREKLHVAVQDSKDIKDLIINANLGLMIPVAMKYRGLMPLTDLCQEGVLGMIRALDTFDHQRGYKFSTYTTPWIRQRMARAIMNTSLPIRLPVHVFEQISKVRRLANEFEVAEGRRPRGEELNELLRTRGGMSDSQIKLALRTLQEGTMRVSSLDKPVDDDGDRVLGDLLYNPRINTEDAAIQGYEDSQVKGAVEQALDEHLDERERRILVQRVVNDRTLESVGKDEDLTRERIRQIQEKALDKLRQVDRLRSLWEAADVPYFFYSRSAESAALGTLKESESFVARATSQLPVPLQSALSGKVYSSNGATEQKRDDEYEYNVARIKVWEGLGKIDREDLLDPAQRREIYGGGFRPHLDPLLITQRYEGNSELVNPADQQVFTRFFGIGTERGFLNVGEVAQELDIAPESVITSLHNTLRFIEASDQRKRQEAQSLRQTRDTIDRAMQNDKVWAQIDDREKSILSLYRRTSDPEVLKDRFSAIFGLSTTEAETLLSDSLSHVRQALGSFRPSGPREWSRILDNFVIKIASERPALTSEEIAAVASDQLDTTVSQQTISRVKSRLRKAGKIQFPTLAEVEEALRPKLADKMRVGFTYKELADEFDQPIGFIRRIGMQLQKDGIIPSRKTVDKGTRTAVQQHLRDHPNEEINLSEIARETGSTRERTRQLYEKLTASTVSLDSESNNRV